MTNTPDDHSSRPPLQSFNGGEPEDEIDLGDLFNTLLDSKWLILAVTLCTLAIGIAKIAIDRPVFQADGLLQIKDKVKPLSGLESLTGILDSNASVAAEIELLNSRMILGKVIHNLHLDIDASPNYFPLIGEAIARQFVKRHGQDGKLAEPLLGLSNYSWGGEFIQVDTFDVPANLENRSFLLEAGEAGRFRLLLDNELILEGKVGTSATRQSISDKHTQPISIFVSVLQARPGTHFTVIRLSENEAILRLRDKISITEKGKGTGILKLDVESHSPVEAVRILNEIANIYLQQNVEEKSAESQKTLAFLEQQLPDIKAQLDAAVDRLNEYKILKGSVDLDIETRNILGSAVTLKTEITLLQQKRDELRQRFTESHPQIIAIDKQIARLQGQMSAFDRQIGSLPETQQVVLELSRDVQVNTELYTAMLNSMQTLRVAKEGTIGNVRIVDYAILPTEPVKPRKMLITGIAFILGLVMGIFAALFRKMLHQGIEDPGLIEKLLNTPVYATVPHSTDQQMISSRFNKKYALRYPQPNILALTNKEDLAIESLRSLRTTLHFAFLEAKNNTLMITGPSPTIGKSFISVNLAAVMADTGKKILLIDGDMRRGSAHLMIGVSRENGLSELIIGTIEVESAIVKTAHPNLDFISAGTIPPNPSELLLHERFNLLLKNISQHYELVIIDSPPVLAVTDAAIIGRLASTTLMVVKAGDHSARELEQSAKKLLQAGVNLKGIVFNDVPESSSSSVYRRYVYQYAYKSGK